MTHRMLAAMVILTSLAAASSVQGSPREVFNAFPNLIIKERLALEQKLESLAASEHEAALLEVISPIANYMKDKDEKKLWRAIRQIRADFPDCQHSPRCSEPHARLVAAIQLLGLRATSEETLALLEMATISYPDLRRSREIVYASARAALRIRMRRLPAVERAQYLVNTIIDLPRLGALSVRLANAARDLLANRSAIKHERFALAGLAAEIARKPIASAIERLVQQGNWPRETYLYESDTRANMLLHALIDNADCDSASPFEMLSESACPLVERYFDLQTEKWGHSGDWRFYAKCLEEKEKNYPSSPATEISSSRSSQ